MSVRVGLGFSYPVHSNGQVLVQFWTILCAIFGNTVLYDNLGERSSLFSMSDALFAEFQSHGLAFHEPLTDTADGLRAFELKDHDGYVLCFGKPI